MKRCVLEGILLSATASIGVLTVMVAAVPWVFLFAALVAGWMGLVVVAIAVAAAAWLLGGSLSRHGGSPFAVTAPVVSILVYLGATTVGPFAYTSLLPVGRGLAGSAAVRWDMAVWATVGAALVAGGVVPLHRRRRPRDRDGGGNIECDDGV